MGEPSKLLLTQGIIQQIKQHNLLQNTQITGQYLYNELLYLARTHNNELLNIRTAGGTFIAYDLPTTELRDKLVSTMRQLGIQSSGCGERTIRLRPQLVFQPKHAVIYIDKLHQALNIIKKQL